MRLHALSSLLEFYELANQELEWLREKEEEVASVDVSSPNAKEVSNFYEVIAKISYLIFRD